jgi:large subunit ribosomal protein L29e
VEEFYWWCHVTSTKSLRSAQYLGRLCADPQPPSTTEDIHPPTLDLHRHTLKMAKSKNSSQANQRHFFSHGRVHATLLTFEQQKGPPQRVRKSQNSVFLRILLMLCVLCSIKKPKTSRYPSLNGTDPKFRRNHRHALHGTMKALVCLHVHTSTLRPLTSYRRS